MYKGIIVSQKNDNTWITSLDTDLIPIENSNGSYHIVPSSNGTFSTPITIRESDDKILVSPFDMFGEEELLSMSLADLISSDSILSKGDKIGDISFKYEFDSDKIDILLNDSSYEKGEFIGILVDILEEYPSIPVDVTDSKPFTPNDLIALIEQLSNICTIDVILENLSTRISSSEFYQLLECKSLKDRLTLFDYITRDYDK